MSEDSEHLPESCEHLPEDSEHLPEDSEHYQKLLKLAKPLRETKKAQNQKLVKETILKICSEHFLSLQTIADLLNRNKDSIRNHYINKMLEEGTIKLKYPAHPNHPNQAYKNNS